MPAYNEEEIAALLRSLPPPPAAWVEAASELPRTRKELEAIMPRIEQDERFRAEVMRDIEATLLRVGVEPHPPLVAALRRRLAADGAGEG